MTTYLSYQYELPPLNSGDSEEVAFAYYMSSDDNSWIVKSIRTKKEVESLFEGYKSQHKEIAKENRITLTGKKRSFWTWLWGSGELPYYRIRVFLYGFFAVILTNIFGIYGIRVFNSNLYALSESSVGWVHVNRANIIEEGKLLDQEELVYYSISPDYKSITVYWRNGVTSFIDLASDALKFAFLDWDNPAAIGYNYDGSQCLAVEENNLIIGKDSIVTDSDGRQFHRTIENYVIDGFEESKGSLILIGYNLLSYNNYDGLITKSLETASNSKSIGGGIYDNIGFCRTHDQKNILLSPKGKNIYLYDLSNESKDVVIRSSCPNPKRICTDAQARLYATVGLNGLFSSGKRQFVIDMYNREYKKLFSCIGHSWTVTSLAFSIDGSRMVSMANDKTVRVWDTHSGKEICRVIIEKSYSDDNFAVFAGNGTMLLIYVEGSLYLYKLP